MLNAATQSLGYYENAPAKKCTKDGLFRDPQNCAGFYSCVKGNVLIRYRICKTHVVRNTDELSLYHFILSSRAGLLHYGHCGHGRFFNPIEGQCVPASPEICKSGYSDRIVTEAALPPLSENEKREKLELLQQNGTRVVCYVTSWALYRKGDGKFVPEHLDPRLCTDIVYAFAGLNPGTLLIQPFDPWADIEHSE